MVQSLRCNIEVQLLLLKRKPLNPLVNHFGLVDLSLLVVATATAKAEISGIRIKAKLVIRVLCTIMVLMWGSQL